MNSTKKNCTACTKEKNIESDFYLASNTLVYSDRRTSVCKDCVKEFLSSDDVEKVYMILRVIDRPFLEDTWSNSRNTERDPAGEYMRMLGTRQNRNKTWTDSEFAIQEDTNNSHKLSSPTNDNLIEKWGEGYSNEEYRSFERKYHMLKNNYQEKTAMHTEALLTYIRYRVKEELSTAKGMVKDAKEWGGLAQKAAQDAKINPSQLSKADLSDGLDTIGQLVRAVETHEDVIPILPQFKSRPQDKVDFNLWCYVNYIRDLKGLPLAEYDEIYAFYEERKKEYSNDPDSLDEEEM